MADPRFFSRADPLSLRRLAEIAGAQPRLAGEPAGEPDPARLFEDVAPLDTAGPSEVTFLDNRRYLPSFEASKAGACIVAPEHADRAPAGMVLLLTETPYVAYARVATAFYPAPPKPSGVHPTALVDETAKLGKGVHVGPYTLIGPEVELADGVVVHGHCSIGRGVRVGEGSEIM